MHCGMCQGGAGLLGQDGQQLDLIFRRCTGGAEHQTPVDGASVTQRERPPPSSVFCVDLPIPAGLAVPFDVGVCRLGRWKANESAVHRLVAGLDLARSEVVNGGGSDAEDLACVGVTEGNARQRDQTPWRDLVGLPDALCRAARFIVHGGVALLSYSSSQAHRGPECPLMREQRCHTRSLRSELEFPVRSIRPASDNDPSPLWC